MSERERFEAAFPEAWSSWDEAAQQYLGTVWPTAWAVWQAARSGQAASGSSQGARSDVQNGVGVGQPEAPTAAPPTALERFFSLGADEETDPVERLRAFCSLAMRGQDWIDVEKFFDALAHPPARSGAGSEEGQ